MKLNHQSITHRVLATAVVALVGAALFAATPVRAEDPAAGAPAPAPETKAEKKADKQEDKMDRRLQEMKTELGLSDDQVAKIKTIREEQFAAMKAIHDDDALSKEDKKEKLKPMKEATDAKISAVLTDDQKTKWAETKKNRKHKNKGQDPANN